MKDISPTENYPAPFLKELYSSEYLSSSEKKLPIDNTQQEVSTTEKNVHEFYPETTVTSNLENYEPTLVNREEQHTQNIDEENTPLDHEFIKTEVNIIINIYIFYFLLKRKQKKKTLKATKVEEP